MTVKSIRDIDIKGKKVFCRVDFNVPLDESGVVKDDTRIRRAIPTISYARDKGAKLILASHLGRPKGTKRPEMSLRPVSMKLGKILGTEVLFCEDCVGKVAKEGVGAIQKGGILLLENLRYHIGETKNDDTFAKELAELADIYVNDAFGTAHRAHASTVGITKYIQEKAAGLLLKEELENLQKAFENPTKPVVGLFGGAKVSDKLGVIQHLADRFDTFLIGGGMANTFLAAGGYNVGASFVESDLIDAAKQLLNTKEKDASKIVLPIDLITAEKIEVTAKTRQVQVEHVGKNEMGLDIGSRTVDSFRKYIDSAGTVIWNGPMGVFEMEPFKMGTMMIARSVARTKGFSVVGGGDTVRAIQQFGVSDSISYISTGGGAFMEFMEGKVLPGVAALEQ